MQCPYDSATGPNKSEPTSTPVMNTVCTAPARFDLSQTRSNCKTQLISSVVAKEHNSHTKSKIP